MRKAALIAAIAIPFIWLGFLLAISFLEAPLKFTAPGIDLKLGLGIGRIVFQALNKLELICLILIFTCQFVHTFPVRIRTLHLLIGGLLIFQTFYLLPALDERAVLILQGLDPGPSQLHISYIVIDVTKSILLLILGIDTVKHATRNSQ